MDVTVLFAGVIEALKFHILGAPIILQNNLSEGVEMFDSQKL